MLDSLRPSRLVARLRSRGTERRDRGGHDAALARARKGARTVLDLATEGSRVALAPDHLRVGGRYRRAFELTRWVRRVSPGWLADLTAMEGVEVDVSVFSEQLPHEAMLEVYRTRLGDQLTANNMAVDDERLPTLDNESAIRDIDRLRRGLHDGVHECFTTSLCVAVTAHSLEKLGRFDEDQGRWTGDSGKVVDFFRQRGGRLEPATGRQHDAFLACQAIGLNTLQRHRTADSRTLAYSAVPCTGSLSMDEGPEYGRDLFLGTPVYHQVFHPTMDNAGTVVLAPTGGGKSYFEKLRELRTLREPVEVEGVGPVFPHVIVIDPENEQLRLAAALGRAAQVVLVRPGNGTCLNPFDVPGAAAEDDAEGQDVFDDHVASTLLPLLQVMLAEPGQVLSMDEVGVLDRAVRDAYARAAPATPLMEDLLFVLERAEGGTAASLASRLHQYVHGSRKGLFTGPTNVELGRRLVVFAVRDVPDALRPVVIQVITAYVWNLVRCDAHPRHLVIDEAGSVLAYPEGGAFLAKVATRARKYWLAPTFIFQAMNQIKASPYGELIAKNCATTLIKQQKLGGDETADFYGLDSVRRRFIKECPRDQALLITPFGVGEIAVEASPLEDELATSNPAQIAAIEARRRTALVATAP